jgi:hypothetical protein
MRNLYAGENLAQVSDFAQSVVVQFPVNRRKRLEYIQIDSVRIGFGVGGDKRRNKYLLLDPSVSVDVTFVKSGVRSDHSP